MPHWLGQSLLSEGRCRFSYKRIFANVSDLFLFEPVSDAIADGMSLFTPVADMGGARRRQKNINEDGE